MFSLIKGDTYLSLQKKENKKFIKRDKSLFFIVEPLLLPKWAARSSETPGLKISPTACTHYLCQIKPQSTYCTCVLSFTVTYLVYKYL